MDLLGRYRKVFGLIEKDIYSKTCVKLPLSKRPKNGFQDRLLHNVGQKYCRMLQGEHSAIPSTFIKLPFVRYLFCLFLSGLFTQVLLYNSRLIGEDIEFDSKKSVQTYIGGYTTKDLI